MKKKYDEDAVNDVPLEDAAPEMEVEALLTDGKLKDNVKLYLADIKRVALLTEVEEKELSNKIKRGNLAKERLKKGGLTLEEEANEKQAAKAAKVAKEELVMCNLRFVVSCAKYYRGRCPDLTFLDLIGYGNLGLIKAVDSFDADKARFTTYAKRPICQAICKGMNENGRLVTLPKEVSILQKKMKNFKQECKEKDDYVPTLDEIAEALNVSVEEVMDAEAWSMLMVRLDGMTGEDNDTPLGETIPDDKNMLVEDQVEYNEEEAADDAWLQSVIKILTPFEYQIVAMYFGWEEEKSEKTNRTMFEMKKVARKLKGKKLNYTDKDVRKILIKALGKLMRADFELLLKCLQYSDSLSDSGL